MSGPWLHIVGIGEDGWDGLSSDARGALEAADVIVGGDRHHKMAPHLKVERLHWPSPFSVMLDTLSELRPRRVAVLVTGDPLWYSAGGILSRNLPASEMVFYPHLSAFQLAASRMRWSLADVETLTVHGRPTEHVIPFFSPGQRLLVFTEGGTCPAKIAQLLVDHGYGPSKITVLENLGGQSEAIRECAAESWAHPNVGEFHTLAVECIPATGTKPAPRTGLPDIAFEHDGQITKCEIRAVTLSALAPRRGATLWDIGAGSGSVSIEWMRAARDANAIAIEAKSERAESISRNARTLGAPRLQVVTGTAPKALMGLSQPDAVFVGGGITKTVVEVSLGALKPFGRLVANAVTLESESLLADLQSQFGGTLARIAVSRADQIGSRRGWRPMMPVTQWVLAT